MPDHPVSETATNDEIVAEMRTAGADYLVNLMFPVWPDEAARLHEYNAELAKRIPKLIPLAGIHLADDNNVPQTVDALDRLGMVGLKIHTMVQHIDPWDTQMHPVYAELEQREKPLWLHTGHEEMYTFAFPDDHLRRLAEKFPQMPVVFAHAIFPRLAEAFAMLDEYPNTYLDMTNVFGSLVHPDKYAPYLSEKETAHLIEVLQEGIATHVGRVVYGTDYPSGLSGIQGMLDDMMSIELPEPARQAMLWDTPFGLFSKWAKAYII
ncbi:MAG: amidohydrolase family protein [Chloroflexota bacterium]